MFLMLFLLPFFFQSELRVEFSNIQEAKGQLYVAVYDQPGTFLKTDQVRTQRIVPITRTGVLSISLSDLPPGKYALSCFHDLNGNGQLDTNWMGIPTEPYGFSNNARLRLRAPNWSEAAFDWSGNGAPIGIRLEKW